MEKTVDIIIRVMPSNEDVEINCPVLTRVGELIEQLIESNIAPRTDKIENPITYRLVIKGEGRSLEEEQTLLDANIKDGDIVLMIPELVAG